MKRLSAKPSTYLIDGSNFALRYRGGGGGRDGLEMDFLDWLAAAARTGALRASNFRVVFDGPFRTPRPAGPSIIIYFSEREPADEIIVERARYLAAQGERAVVVTSDQDLRSRAAAEGAVTLACEVFLKLADDELRKESR